MSRPDLLPHERDEWEASVHAELETRTGWPTTSQMDLMRRRSDTLATRMAASHEPLIPWSALVVALVVLGCAALVVFIAVHQPLPEHAASPVPTTQTNYGK